MGPDVAMRTFEFVATLLSIIISLAFAHLLSGIAHIIQNGVKRFSLLLTHWIAFCLFLCVDYWFTIWHARNREIWSLGYVCLLLAQGAIIYVAARLVVPAPTHEGPIDLTAFFDHHRRKFMGAIAVLAIVNEATNLTLEGFNTSLLAMMVVAWVVLAVTALLFKSYRVQYAVAVANVILTAWYAVTFVPAL
jgi:hypothetical protein